MFMNLAPGVDITLLSMISMSNSLAVDVPTLPV